MTQLTLISKHYQDVAPEDIEGLNQFALLVDRSQTALTEVGINYFRPGVGGAPHYHDAKEQLFFIISGNPQNATITVAGKAYPSTPYDLIHIPMGVMHQTTLRDGPPMAHLIVNAFKDETKEGKETFAAHVAVSRHQRRKQADDAAGGVPIDWARTGQPGRHMPLPATEGTGPQVVHLIAPPETLRCTAKVVTHPAGSTYELNNPPGIERTIFVISGKGTLHAENATWPVGAGQVVYLPPAWTASLQAEADEMRFLSISVA